MNIKNRFFDLDSHRDMVFILSGVALFIFISLASINPYDRFAWFLDFSFTLIILLAFLLTHKYFRFSPTSYIMLSIFGILVTIGTYYTFSLVPLGFLEEHFARNPYDRFAHFMSGFLVAYPLREFFVRKKILEPTGFWSYSLPVLLVLSSAAIYEIIEWIFAVSSTSETSIRLYLGLGDDVWDAQKDMLMAGLGGFLIMVGNYFKNCLRHLKR